jgi:hypothetical protein
MWAWNYHTLMTDAQNGEARIRLNAVALETATPARQWINAEVLTPWDTSQSLKTTRLASLEILQIQLREEIARLQSLPEH